MSKLEVNEIAPRSAPGIGVGGANVQPGAIINVQSTQQGIAPYPRMTTVQRNSIPSPFMGLFIYNTDTNQVEKYNGTSWGTAEGIKSINGMTDINQIIDTGTAGLAPNLTQTGTNKNTINIPLAVSAGVTAGLISNGEFESFNSRLDPMLQTLYVMKNPTLHTQGFNDIQDAIDSISDNSSAKPYKIVVGPGIYTRSLTLKPFVWVEGSEQDQTIIVASGSNHTIIGADNSGISKCLIRGAPSGKAGVYYRSTTGTTNTAFFVEDCRFGDNDTLALADGTDASTAIFVDSCKIGSTYQFNHGFLATSGGRIICRMLTTTGLTAPFPDYVFKGTGTGSQIVINGAQIRSGTVTTGACIHLADGAILRALSLNIRMFGKGLWSENTGAGQIIDAVAVLMEGNTTDVQIDHPSTDGTFNGSADHTKILVNPSSTFSLVFSSNKFPSDSTGFVTVGDILQGDRYDRLANLSLLARKTTTLGVVSDEETEYLAIDSGLNIEVAEGTGFLNDPTDIYLKQITWSTTIVALPANSTRYIYVDTNGTIQASASLPSLETVIVLGRVNTGASTIRFVENSDLTMNHYGNKAEYLLRNVFGPIFHTGCIITENATPRKLDSTAGTYHFGVGSFAVSGGPAISWETFHQNGSGGFTSLGMQDTVSNTQYDDGSGSLVSIPGSNYARHHLYVVGDGGNEKWFLVYAQATYPTLGGAQNAALPVIPTFLSDAVVRVAGIIVRAGDANITSPTIDLRPRLGFAAPSGTAVTDHGSLTGLLDDDHPQYLLVNGTRAMTGNLDMGGQNITNVNLVDGVDIPAHGSRHLPNGADPLTTAAPLIAVGGNTANQTGTANSLARSDHQHDVATGAPVQQLPDQSNTEGASNNLARADHVHNIPTAAPTTNIDASTVNSQGVGAAFSRNDHQHGVNVGTPAALVPGAASAQGASANLSRADHQHGVPVGTPVDVGTANAPGSAGSLARSDHVHAHGAQTNPAQHALATPIAHGFMSDSDKSKLNGIEAGATADQIASEVPFSPTGGLSSTDVQAALAELDSEKQAISQKGAPNGYASLDGGGKVPVSQLPDTVVGSVDYKGTWNANTNTPNLVTAIPDKGDYYVVNVAGSTSLGGITDWKIGDWAIYNGTAWEKVDNTDQVTSVFGRQGVVVAADADYAANQITYNNASSGLAATRVQAAIDEVEARLDSNEALTLTHASRHLPSGADPLTTAAPTGTLGGASTNAVGTANSLARSDHSHDVATGTPSAQTPDQSNAEGSSNNLARADHIHNVPTATPTDISDSTNSQGAAATFVKSDHVHSHGNRGGGTLHAAATQSANGFMSAADKTKADNRPEIDAGWFKYEEFISLLDGSNQANNTFDGDMLWAIKTSGAASGTSANTAKVDSNHPGVAKVQSAAGGGNYALMFQNPFIILGGGVVTYETLVQVETLATAGNDYTCRIGFGDSTTGADNANGAYFEYNRGTSANWIIKTASASTRTSTTTSTAVSAGSWVKLKIVINAAASSIEFFINGSSVGTITTNIPGVVVGLQYQQTRVAGTPVGFDVDYMRAYQIFTSAR